MALCKHAGAAVVLAGALASAGLATSATLRPHDLSKPAAQSGGGQPGAIYLLTGYLNAVCNDGTPGAYYFRKSQDGSTKWLFYLEGGQQCHDLPSCMKNYTKDYQKITSTGWTIAAPGGVISTSPTVNPALWDANVVEVHSCSGDVWSGTKAATTAFMPGNADTGWYFEGRAIALAAIKDLHVRDADTGFSTASDVLFAGSSGGALGIVYNINDLLPYAPRKALKRMALDAGYALQIYSFDHTLPPTYMTTVNPYNDTLTAGIPFWNGYGETTCAAAAVTFQDQIDCYDTGKLLAGGYVTLPAFIAESQLDTNQMSKHHFGGDPYKDVAHSTYATEWVNAIVASLQATSPINSVFAPQRQTHTFFGGSQQFDYAEEFPGYTLSASDALNNWYNAPGTSQVEFGNQDGFQ